MPEAKLARAPIEPGEESRVREWYAQLQAREEEVIETMDYDGVLTESAFLGSDGETTYLYVYMESPDLAAAQASGDEEAFEVHEQHHAVLAETLAGGWEDLDPIAHFADPDR